MATIRKRNGKYQVQIRRSAAKPRSKTFIKLSDARLWAAAQESSPAQARASESSQTFDQLVERYRATVLQTLKGQKQESSRLKVLQKKFGSTPCRHITNAFLANYRDSRLTQVGPQSVKHEINLLRKILRLGQQEWETLLPDGVPTVRMPRLPRGRERRVSDAEINLLKQHLTQQMENVVQIALATGMRRSEILAIESQDIVRSSALRIPESKTGRQRFISLQPDTLKRIIFLLAEGRPKPDSVSQAFRRACVLSDLKDLHFHDLRHEAISRMFELGLTVPEVAAVSGHSDFRMLARYAHAGAIKQRL